MGVKAATTVVTFLVGSLLTVVAQSNVRNIVLELSSVLFWLLRRYAYRICCEERSNRANPAASSTGMSILVLLYLLTPTTRAVKAKDAAVEAIVQELQKLVRALRLKGFNGKVFLILDGDTPAVKAEEAAVRIFHREQASRRFESFKSKEGPLSNGQKWRMKKAAKASISFSSITDRLVTALNREFGDDENVIVCPEPLEADFKVAELMWRLPNSLIFSNDSDFLFRPVPPGCNPVFFRSLHGWNRQYIGEFICRSDVLKSFGLAAPVLPDGTVEILSRQHQNLQNRLMVGIFSGAFTDYQKHRPREITWTKWINIVCDVWSKRNDGEWSNLSCKQLTTRLIGEAKLKFPKISDEQYQAFNNGIMNTLSAVLDGVFSSKGITGGRLGTSPYLKASFESGYNIFPADFNRLEERAKFDAAVKIARIQLEERWATRQRLKLARLEGQQKQSHAANEKNSNSYPRMLVVKSDFAKCKGLTYANDGSADGNTDEESKLAAYRELAEKIIYFVKALKLPKASKPAAWSFKQCRDKFTKWKEKIFGDTPLSEASPVLSCGLKFVESLCEWEKFGYKSGQASADEINKQVEILQKLEAKRLAQPRNNDQRRFINLMIKLERNDSAELQLVGEKLKLSKEERTVEKIAMALGYRENWSEDFRDVYIMKRVLQNRLKIPDMIDWLQKQSEEFCPTVQLLRQAALKNGYDPEQWEAESKKLNFEILQQTGKGNRGVATKVLNIRINYFLIIIYA